MAITVAELVAVPFVKMRFHAGESGGDRLITWAHTSDLPNATDWLGPGDLLLSNGLSLPSDEERQVAFLTELVSAGLSGFALGDDMDAPALTPAVLGKAEELRFPVLGVPRDVPFVAISRAVANANRTEEHDRLVRTVQLYESLRGGLSSARAGESLMSSLSRRLGCSLAVIDPATALPVLDATSEIPASVQQRLVEEVGGLDGVLPGALRLTTEGGEGYALKIPVERPTALLALENGDAVPDLALLQHAANIVALEVERVYAEREQRRRQGQLLFGRLLERSVEPGSALRQLEEHGIAAEEVVVVAFRPAPGHRQGDLHHDLAQRRVAHLGLGDDQRCLMMVVDTEDALTTLGEAAGRGGALGVSDPLGRPDRAPDAAREARWAQTAANNLGRPLVRYGEGTPLFLPRTLGEAAMAAERVLGPVIEYDAEHGTELVSTLAVFLEHNRSWQRSSEALHVHKQTLVYRMRRVEELTGRELRDTADVVQFWLALRALDFAHGEVGGSSFESP